MDRGRGREEEINKAILEWLIAKKYTNSVDQFVTETKLKKEDCSKNNSLEKRWGTILTLQKKVTDLETQVKTLKEELERAGTDGLNNGVAKKVNESMVLSFYKFYNKAFIQIYRNIIFFLIFPKLFSFFFVYYFFFNLYNFYNFFHFFTFLLSLLFPFYFL